MTITVVVVGRARGSAAAAIRDFEERAGRYWKLQVIEVDAGSGGGGKGSAQEVRSIEAERILARIPEDTSLVALTRQGRGMTSRGLARYLQSLGVSAARGVTFVIGGAFGLGAQVLERADLRLSLSPMTLPHEVARLVLVEQIYRAGTMARGEPYHKGE